MAWSAPATAVANTFLTAAFWNTQVRDNLLETAPAKAAAAGDSFYATAANAIARLAAGATGSLKYQAAGAVPAWLAPGASNGGLLQQAAGLPSWLQPVAYRMPRANTAGNLMEYVAGLNLAQAPVYARSGSAQNMGNGFASIATIVSQSFTSVGGIVIAIWFCQSNEGKSAAAQAFNGAGLYRASVAVGDLQIMSTYLGAAGNYGAEMSGVHLWTPGAGAATYEVKAYYVSNSTTGTPNANAQLLLVELAP